MRLTIRDDEDHITLDYDTNDTITSTENVRELHDATRITYAVIKYLSAMVEYESFNNPPDHG